METTPTLPDSAALSAPPPRDELVAQIAQLIINSVNLRHVDPLTLGADTALTAGGLELDSVDILEVVVAVEQRFGLRVKDTDDGKRIFSTIGSIADFVQSRYK